MGQEWAASTPFLFFTDHYAELGRRVTEGRREEFRQFAAFRDPDARARIPDPQRMETFWTSKLNWNEQRDELPKLTFRLYQELLRLRREVPILRNRSRATYSVSCPDSNCVQLSFGRADEEQWLVLADLKGGRLHSSLQEKAWRLVLSTNEKRFGGDDGNSFTHPEVRVFRRAYCGSSGN
jgi:maltooligosyltrehalose trehalohydrolase